MARIGRNLNIPNVTTNTGGTEVTPGNATGLTGDQKFNLLIAASVGFGVVCLLAMLAMLCSTWQFKSNSYNEYSNVIRDYNEKRYIMLENRVKDLENKVASLSEK